MNRRTFLRGAALTAAGAASGCVKPFLFHSPDAVSVESTEVSHSQGYSSSSATVKSNRSVDLWVTFEFRYVDENGTVLPIEVETKRFLVTADGKLTFSKVWNHNSNPEIKDAADCLVQVKQVDE